jgi:hypothetical protein
MRPFSDVKPDGTLRDPRAVAARLNKAKASRSRRTNGKVPFDQRSSQARRLDDLMRAYTSGVEHIDEVVLILARSAACMTVRVEKFEEQIAKGHDVDDHILQRVSNSLTRALLGLNRLKASKQVEGTAGITLAEHLEQLAKRREVWSPSDIEA